MSNFPNSTVNSHVPTAFVSYFDWTDLEKQNNSTPLPRNQFENDQFEAGRLPVFCVLYKLPGLIILTCSRIPICMS